MSQSLILVTTHRVLPAQVDEFKASTLADLDAAEAEVSLVHIHPDRSSADQHVQVAGDRIVPRQTLTETVGTRQLVTIVQHLGTRQRSTP